MKVEVMVALLAGGLAGFAGSLLAKPAAESPLTTPVDVHIDLAPLLTELRSLRRTLELPSLSGERQSGDMETPAALLSSAEGGVTNADLKAFLDSFSELLTSAQPATAEASSAVRTGYERVHDRQAVEMLRATLTENPEYSPASVFALTPRQVYSSYGTPTTTWEDKGSTRWVYMSEDEETMTVLEFRDGYVVKAWLE
jgi:hypothetical protein